MKKQKGITLIGLVITIIVLLILAGVSLSVLTGENGILNQADRATEETRRAAAKEEVELAWDSADAEYWKSWGNNSSVKRETYFDEPADLNKYLAGKGEIKSVTPNEDGTEYTIEYESAADENVYTIKVDANGNAKVEGEGVHKSKDQKRLIRQITAANYGDEVANYGIDINGDNSAEGDWKIFYSNGTNVFLIASDYVDKTLVIAGMDQDSDTNYPYNVYWSSAPSTMSTTARKDALFGITADSYTLNERNLSSICVSTMLDTANWEGFKDAEGYGEYAIGGPTVEMWMASWNAKGAELGTDKYESLKTQNGSIGYYVGPTSTSDLEAVAKDYDLSLGGYRYTVGTDTEGYDDPLYFPHQSVVSHCYGYWLASPSAFDGNAILYVDFDGGVRINDFKGSFCVRPVVSLSSEVLGKQEEGSWTLSK